MDEWCASVLVHHSVESSVKSRDIIVCICVPLVQRYFHVYNGFTSIVVIP